MKTCTINDVRAHVILTPGMGGNYTSREPGHWMVDERQANPLSVYPGSANLRAAEASEAVGGILVEIETDAGISGVATGVGGAPACGIIENHLARFLIGSDPRDIARLWDQMYRATLPYGRMGLALMAISAVDLALWDTLGKLRDEPVYMLAGGATKEALAVYCTGPRPAAYRDMGFFGAKVPFPFGPADGRAGFKRNVEAIAAHRESVGAEFPLMVDCYMSLDVRYAIDFAHAVRPFGLYWIEEALPADDVDGYRQLKAAAPWVRWATGEHEYTRYGFRRLIESRAIDVLQPDLMWTGGFTEALRIGALAAAYDIPVVPHAGGIYSYHFAMTQAQTPFVEYCITSPQGDKIEPVFGNMFTGEPLAKNGTITLSDAPGWGLTLDRNVVALASAHPRKRS